jgi:WhiB family redox-sensing transcriptional regulator
MDEATVAALMVPGDLSLDEVVARPAWHQRAACRGQGTASFFPSPGDSLNAARAFCRRCDVQAECLAAALADAGLQGFWGGTSERERRLIRRERRARAARPTTGVEESARASA